MGIPLTVHNVLQFLIRALPEARCIFLDNDFVFDVLREYGNTVHRKFQFALLAFLQYFGIDSYIEKYRAVSAAVVFRVLVEDDLHHSCTGIVDTGCQADFVFSFDIDRRIVGFQLLRELNGDIVSGFNNLILYGNRRFKLQQPVVWNYRPVCYRLSIQKQFHILQTVLDFLRSRCGCRRCTCTALCSCTSLCRKS